MKKIYIGIIASAVLALGMGIFFFNDIKRLYTGTIAEPTCTKTQGINLVKQKKYHRDAQIEHAVISVRESDTSDRTFLRKGILITRPQAKATIIICHGFMCNKNDVGFLRTLFADYNVMMFDFRAHGENIEGQCCSFGVHEVHDLEGVVKFVKSKPELAKLPLISYGFSMGAVTTILTQAKNPGMFDALILDCPFDSTEMLIHRLIERLSFSIAGHEFGLPGRRLLKRHAYDPAVQALIKMALKTIAQVSTNATETCMLPAYPVKEIKKVTVPCFFVSCKRDDKAPIDAVKTIYQNAPGYKRLWLTNGRSHFDSFFYNPEKYMYKVRKFLDDFLSGAYKKKSQAKIVQDTDDVSMMKGMI